MLELEGQVDQDLGQSTNVWGPSLVLGSLVSQGLLFFPGWTFGIHVWTQPCLEIWGHGVLFLEPGCSQQGNALKRNRVLWGGK